MFDDQIKVKVQQANDIVDVISEHVSLTKKGREMVGLCPFHDDHRPSLNVSSSKQIFKCYACGAGGDVFKFVQLRENLTFPQAIERLAQRAGISIKNYKSKNTKPHNRQQDIDPNKLAKINSWAADYFQQNFRDEQKGKIARDYLDKRKITLQEAEKWQLGYAGSDNGLLRAAKRLKISRDLLIKAGLITGDSNDKFINRLMFPITDVSGRVVGFGGRTLDESGAKYLNSPATPLFDKSSTLYGLQQARHHIVSGGKAVVVEGYTDCIMAHQFGCQNVVATLGTSFTNSHGRILQRYAQQAVLLFDNDLAGIEASNRAVEICLSQHIDIKITTVPERKDPCDFILSQGKEAFEKLVDRAVDVFQFKWNRLLEKLGREETLGGKKQAVEEFLQAIAKTIRTGRLAALDRGLIINRLSKITGLESREINTELRKRLVIAKRKKLYNVQNQKNEHSVLGDGLSALAQREILEVLLNEPKLFELVQRRITVEIFDVPVLAQIATVLFKTLSEKKVLSLTGFLGEFESTELGSIIVDLARSGQEKGNFESRLKGALGAIQQCKSRGKNRELKTTEEQMAFLRHICENAEKANPHNVGMV